MSVPAPDQRGGHADPGEVRRWDRRERTPASGRRARPGRGVPPGRVRSPPSVPSARPCARAPVEVGEALREHLVPGTRARLLGELVAGGGEARRRSELVEAERIDQHEPSDRSPPRAKRTAIAAPRPRPTTTGGAGRSARPAHPASRATSRRQPPRGVDAPWPGRSGAITRWVRTRSGITPSQSAANSPAACSNTSGGPAPPSRTAVATPASVVRRSVTGDPGQQPFPRGRPRVLRMPHVGRVPRCRVRGAPIGAAGADGWFHPLIRRGRVRRRTPWPPCGTGTSSLARMLLTCRSTVRSLSTSSPAMARLDLRPRPGAAPAARAG